MKRLFSLLMLGLLLFVSLSHSEGMIMPVDDDIGMVVLMSDDNIAQDVNTITNNFLPNTVMLEALEVLNIGYVNNSNTINKLQNFWPRMLVDVNIIYDFNRSLSFPLYTLINSNAPAKMVEYNLRC